MMNKRLAKLQKESDISDTHRHPVHSLWRFPPVYIILHLQMLLSEYQRTAMQECLSLTL